MLPKFQLQKFILKMLKKRILFGFLTKFCQNNAGITYPVVMSYFFKLEEALIGFCACTMFRFDSDSRKCFCACTTIRFG